MEKGKKKESEITIAFMGDVMIGRLVNEQISLTDYAYPWGNVLPMLLETDLNIINLEAALTVSQRKEPKVFNFKADPEKVRTLKEARIDVVNLANNHVLDFAEEGLLETLDVLDGAGIRHVGAGRNIGEAKRGEIVTIKGIKIGVIGFTDNEPGWVASDESPGTNYVRVGDTARIRECVNEVRDRVDYLILSIHWGPNMRQRPSSGFVEFAHKIIDSGVDIIHGHSAHIFQGIEIYRGKVIMYDTGDFVDDYMVDPILRNDRSFLFLITLDRHTIRKITLIPVLISNMQVNLSTGADYRETIDRMKRLSRELGTELKENKGLYIELG